MNATPAWRYGPAVVARQVRVTADDGCLLNVRVLREPRSDSGTPIVFLHALAMDGDMWQGVVDALDGVTDEAQDAGTSAPAGGLYALDCRGHGLSQSSDERFTVQRFATDLANVLDALGAARAHIVGCSMGGTVALGFAGRFAARVASLTVIDTTAWYGPQARANWEKRAQAALTDGMASLIDFQLARWFSPDFLQQQPDLVRASIAVFTANRVPAYVNSCRMLGQADEREVLANYGGPAEVVVGEDDYATPPSMAMEIESRLTGARLTVIAGTRHYTPLEAPGQLAACIRQVMGRADTSLQGDAA